MNHSASDRPLITERDVRRARRLGLALFMLCLLAILAGLLLGGCAGPWREHYTAGESAAARAAQGRPTAAPVRIVTKHPSVLWMADPPAGLVEIGSSRFVAEVEYGPAGLDDLARELGAVEVWLAVEPSGTITRSGVTRMPVTDRARTTGTVAAADGSRTKVDLTTSTTRWEDVPVTSTRQRWLHSARFFAATAINR
jgi:hypothetical protein